MVDQVRFPPSIGGSGKTYTNDANPETGVYGGGHRINFFPMLADNLAGIGYVANYAQAIDGAKANADRAEDAKGFVEAVVDAYKVNILDPFKRRSTLGMDFVEGRYWKDDGDRFETNDPNEILSNSRTSPKEVKGVNDSIVEILDDKLAREWEAGVAQGALIEGSRTNYALRRNDLSNPFWVKDGSTTVTQAGDHWIVEGATSISVSSGADVLRSQSVSIPFAETCASVELKSSDIASMEVRLRWVNMTQGGNYYVTAELKNHWQTFESPAVGAAGDFWRLYIGSSEKFLARNFQFEEGLYSTSRIKTIDVPVTRSRDDFLYNLGSEFNGSRGTIFFEHGGVNQINTAMFFAIGSDSNNYLSFGYTENNIGYFVPFQANLGNGAVGKKSLQRWAVSYEVLSPDQVKLIICVNGNVEIDQIYDGDASLISSWDKITIGSRFSSFRAVSIKALQLYYSPKESSVTELQELSAL
ncbi:hypothetical protein ELY33_17230 [Vreelandella andesensis]|uniref:Uncharacterized protein n=1 Tax=Vreelandella andesensis TaxID=447567 RepID=A0A433KFC6_9GAMM|nr:hypothetical protein [Halomonas andesensis]RUR26851.1 hypothetical protein ELY33_17230 [Halomonas andesensis]